MVNSDNEDTLTVVGNDSQVYTKIWHSCLNNGPDSFTFFLTFAVLLFFWDEFILPSRIL